MMAASRIYRCNYEGSEVDQKEPDNHLYPLQRWQQDIDGTATPGVEPEFVPRANGGWKENKLVPRANGGWIK